MKTQVQVGKILDLIAPSGGVTSGQMVKIGWIFGVVLAAAAQGEQMQVAVDEVHELTKKSTDDVEAGDLLYFDESEDELTLTAGDNMLVGAAVEDAGNTATLVKVRLNGAACGGTAANQAAVATANGSDAGTTQALANALKVAHNDLLTKLKAAGIMVAD